MKLYISYVEHERWVSVNIEEKHYTRTYWESSASINIQTGPSQRLQISRNTKFDFDILCIFSI